MTFSYSYSPRTNGHCLACAKLGNCEISLGIFTTTTAGAFRDLLPAPVADAPPPAPPPPTPRTWRTGSLLSVVNVPLAVKAVVLTRVSTLSIWLCRLWNRSATGAITISLTPTPQLTALLPFELLENSRARQGSWRASGDGANADLQTVTQIAQRRRSDCHCQRLPRMYDR